MEYDTRIKALCVSEFVSNSKVQQSGVVHGMYLTQVDDLNVMGLKQGDVVFILQQKASNMRELIFSDIDVSKYAVPKPEPQIISRDLRSQSANLSSMDRPSLLTDRNNSSTTNHGNGMYPKPPKPKPTSSDRMLPTGIASDHLRTHTLPTYSKTPPTSNCIDAGYKQVKPTKNMPIANSNLSSLTTSQGDPFSTPARRRRLVADISRFLLKQYCLKACENVHVQRVRYSCAVIIQSAVRRWRAVKVLLMLRFEKQTSAAIRMQVVARSRAARAELQRRRELRLLLLSTALAVKMQCIFRVRRAKAIRARLEREKAELLALMERCVIIIQCAYRQYTSRRVVVKRRKARERMIKLQHRAALKLECAYRRRAAVKAVDALRRAMRTKDGMAYRISRQWKKYRAKMHGAATVMQKIYRGHVGRTRAAGLKRELLQRQEEERCRRNELMLMRREDELSHFLRDQEAVEIRVELPSSLLHCIRRCSVKDTIQWCIVQSVLEYDSNKDEYTVGELIRRVMRAANLNTTIRDPSLLDTSGHDSEIDILAPTPAIRSHDLPPDSSYPGEWGARHISRHSAGGEYSRYLSYSAEYNDCMRSLTVSMGVSGRVVLLLERPVNIYRCKKNKGSSYCYDNANIAIILVESSHDSRPMDASNENKPPPVDVEQTTPVEYSDNNKPMLEFKFKDVCVSVSVTAMADDKVQNIVEEEHPRSEVEAEESEAKSETNVEDVIEVEESDSEEEEVIVEVRPATSRPSTATTRMRVSLFDELEAERARLAAEEAARKEAEERAIQEALRIRSEKLLEILRRVTARKIQRAYNIYRAHQLLVSRITKLQRFLRRSMCMGRWHFAVRMLMQRATFSVTRLQSYVRRKLAVSLCRSVRKEVCRDIYSSLSEAWWEERLLKRYSYAPGGSGVDVQNACQLLDNSLEDVKKEITARILDYRGIFSAKDQEMSEDSGLYLTTVERTHGGKTSMQGCSPWAANIMHIMEIPQPPENCVLPHDILFYSDQKSESLTENATNNTDDDNNRSFGTIKPYGKKVNMARYKSPPQTYPPIYENFVKKFS
eukprot:CAMPEP_0185035606 /NCGR_PEP_ID=MMETSP1103-20130426/27269_1 /TAXON_ID=36769 /ORGANISM="Paraphysomonas bandaiensis, Strain Caron Lab Isolate" /LENGTH=1057 /DNA_ID=CAMNT_0027572761 /DNA_START=57 /DNA_END=3230 /DNA_ORIENTATION=-